MNEGSQKPKTLSERAEKMGRVLGSGPRMSEEEKVAYLKEHMNLLRINVDFVSVETYRALFASLDLEGKTVVNVGAGTAIGGSYNGMSPLMEALNSLDEKVVCIPLDYSHTRTKSWDLLDTDDPAKDGPVTLAPVTGDATALPFADASIDGYVSANLINEPRKDESEVVFVKKLLAEAYRVLSPGGFIVLSSFGYFWWKTADGKIVFNDLIDEEEIVSVAQIERYLRDAGFTEIRPIPLDQTEIQEVIAERRARKSDAVDTGVSEACAFFARK
ncbi:MAG: methyltransferase domain-containing protein [Patescibacteria group bacterium]